jgi:hypothetical protein
LADVTDIPSTVTEVVAVAPFTASLNRLATATDAAFRDGKQLRAVVNQFKNCDLVHRQGRAFEALEALKFNQDAVRRGTDLVARMTHDDVPTGKIDIKILRDDEVVAEVQAKSYRKAAAAVTELRSAGYTHMRRLVPSDKEEEVRRLVDARLEQAPGGIYAGGYQDVSDNLQGRLSEGDVSSPGTTRTQAERAAKRPRLVTAQLEGAAVLREIGLAAAGGAAIAGGTRALFAAGLQAVEVQRGEQDVTGAVVETIKASVDAAAKGGAIAGGAQAIVIAARRAGWRDLAAGAAPRAITAGVLDLGLATHRYVSGKTDTVTYKEEAGGAALQSIATFYCGMAGQLLLPVPVMGGMVGSLVGYVTASMLVESGLLGVGPANVVAEAQSRREEVEAHSLLAIAQMDVCRADLEVLLDASDQRMAQQIIPALDAFECALAAHEIADATEALGALVATFRGALPFRTLEEFDAFMDDADTPPLCVRLT